MFASKPLREYAWSCDLLLALWILRSFEALHVGPLVGNPCYRMQLQGSPVQGGEVCIRHFSDILKAYHN